MIYIDLYILNKPVFKGHFMHQKLYLALMHILTANLIVIKILTFCISLCCCFFLWRSKSFLLIGFVKSKQQFKKLVIYLSSYVQSKSLNVEIWSNNLIGCLHHELLKFMGFTYSLGILPHRLNRIHNAEFFEIPSTFSFAWYPWLLSLSGRLHYSLLVLLSFAHRRHQRHPHSASMIKKRLVGFLANCCQSTTLVAFEKFMEHLRLVALQY